MKYKGLNLLLSAATVNRRFCTTLLDDPAQALAAGYFGQTFSLTPEERDMVIGIRAQHLEDLAEQISCWMQFNGNGRNGNGHNGHNGNGHNGHNGNGKNGHYRQPLTLAELEPAW